MRKAWNLLHLRRIQLAAAATRPVIISPSQAPHFILSSTAAGGELSLLSPFGKFGCFNHRCYYSEPAVAAVDPDAALSEALTMVGRLTDAEKDLESLNAAELTHDSILKALRDLDGVPDVARQFFDWVVLKDGKKLSSKSYNLMLGVLGSGKQVAEFWDFVDLMKKKGYGVSKSTFFKVSEVFEKEGLVDDLSRLKDEIAPKQPKIYKIVVNGEWGEDDMERLGGLSDKLDKVTVVRTLEVLKTQPKKAFAFFKWVCKSSTFETDAEIYNVMARVLGREDSIAEFWSLINEMIRLNFELDKGTYVRVFEQFLKRKMMKEAVDLYEYKMQTSFKPSELDGVLLMRKIAGSNCPDIELFSRVVQIFTSAGHVLDKSIFDTVVKSLSGATNLGQCDEFLKVMRNVGLEASSSIYSKVVFGYCRAKQFDEAGEYLVELSKSECLDSKPWMCFIEELCRAKELGKAVHWFQQMVDKFGPDNSRHSFHELIEKFCRMKKPQNACNFLVKMVETKQVNTSLITYETLIKSLLREGHFEKAVSLIPVMKIQGFPPVWRLYVNHISKSGSARDAFNFLMKLSVKKYPSTSVFVEMFMSFLKAERLDVAHNLLSLCPRYIRNDPDVLELFHSISKKEVVSV